MSVAARILHAGASYLRGSRYGTGPTGNDLLRGCAAAPWCKPATKIIAPVNWVARNRQLFQVV